MHQAGHFPAGRQVAAFTIGLAAASAGLGLWLRWGIHDLDLVASGMALLATSACVLMPVVLIERSKASQEAGAVFYGALTVGILFLILLLGRAGTIGQGLVAGGTVLCLADLVSRPRADRAFQATATFLIGALFGTLIAICIQGGGYLTSFSQDFLPVGGDAVKTDTYMHLALSQMIRHQGVVSTGVDDVIPLKVYFLAHAVIGYLSDLLGGEIARVADEAYRIVMLPLMFGSVLSAAVSLTGGRGQVPVFAAIIGAGVLLYPLRTYFFSETYVIALFVFEVMVVPFVGAIALQRVQTTAHRAAIAVIGLAGIALANLGKPGVGTLAAGLFGLVAWIDAWRRPTRSQRLLWMALAAVAVVIVFVPSFLAVSADIMSSVIGTEGGRSYYFNVGAFWRRFPAMNSIALMAVAGLLLPSRWTQLGAEKYVLLFVLLVFVAAANLPGFSVIGYQWQYYILNVQMWFALPILAALGGMILSSPITVRAPRAAQVALVAVLAVACVLPSAPLWTRYLPTMRSAQERLAAVQHEDVAAARAKLFDEIVSYRDEFRGRLRVYVPPSNREFWTWAQHCEARSMVIPAATGVPVIDGYPPLWTQCESEILFRGWQVIPKRQTDDVKDDQSLCREAGRRQTGPAAIYVLNSLSQTSSNRLLRCEG